MVGSVDELLAAGRAALSSGDGAGARALFEQAYEVSPSAEGLEGLARAAYLDLDFPRAIELWERAYAGFREVGDQVSAVRIARTLAYTYGSVVGDFAVMSGWMARAQTLLGGAPDSPEVGWVALNMGMFESDREVKEARFREALVVARRLGQRDLEFVTVAYLGASMVHGGQTTEGMQLLDEALAAVAGSEVDGFLELEEIFCQLFSACEHVHDVNRADQWIRIGELLAERRNLPSVSAFCRTHYGGILTAAGRWTEADAALTEAVRLWGLGNRSLRGGALVRLAELRVRQGRYEEAEQLLEGLEVHVEAARPLATIHLARGETSVARDVLERALAQLEPTTGDAAPLLALLVEVHVADGRLDAAEAAADGLAACARAHPNEFVTAAAAMARGRVCAATGEGDPRACFHEALASFARAQLPMELARCRLALASSLVDERPEVAAIEARAALEVFDRMQATHDADAAAAVLRSLGIRTSSSGSSRGTAVLTRREAEVLDLLGHGLSNPEIAERLYISRKTVEHHVGNVLAKLNLRSRGEAAAYATRSKPGGE